MTIEGISGSGLGPQGIGGAPPGAAASELVRLGAPAGGTLLEQVRAAAAGVAAAVGRGGDVLGSARVETALLGFAREVRALHIGCPDIPESARDLAVAAALAAGNRDADALPNIGFDAADRLVATLEGAARALSADLSPSLFPPAGKQGV